MHQTGEQKKFVFLFLFFSRCFCFSLLFTSFTAISAKMVCYNQKIQALQMQTVPINQKPPNIKTKLKQKRRKGNKKKKVFIAPLSFLFCLMGLFLCSSFSVIFLTCHEVAEKSACIIERERSNRGNEESGGWWVI